MDRQEHEAKIKAINLAIDHILEKGCDDIFRPPTFSVSLEHQIIGNDVVGFRKRATSDTLKFLNNANLEHSRIGPIGNTLVVKDDRAFRSVSWIDPFDSVKYLSLCLLLFPKIEAARIPENQNIIHSHRISKLENEIFDRSYGYNSFRAQSGVISREQVGRWKVITDISNFFDRIGNHSLENHLLDVGCDKKLVTLLREVLLFWAGDRRSFGVPVGSDASRIISEAVLIDVDRKLHQLGVNFLRYVDDFRIFTSTRAEAYSAIQLLTSLLADEGLSLNAKKTEVLAILDEEDPALDMNRFVATEHETIDLEHRVEIKRTVRISGRTQISKYYQEPGKEALRKIRQLKKEDLISAFEAAAERDIEDGIKLIMKFFVHAEQDTSLIELMLRRRVTSIFYISDALIKEKDKLSSEKREEALISIVLAFDWDKAPYPYQVPVLRLMADQEYKNDELARLLIDGQKLSGNALFYRELILLCFRNLDRPRIRELALVTYPQVQDFVKRAIFRAVADHPNLSEEEKRPLLKNMRQHSDDWFIDRIKMVTAP